MVAILTGELAREASTLPTMVFDDAYDELLTATPPGWFVGKPSFHDERRVWIMYAFDPRERAVAGRRKREWETEAPTEEAVIRSMAHCLREIAAGRVPK